MNQKSNLGVLFDVGFSGIFAAICLSIFYFLAELVDYRDKRFRIQNSLEKISKENTTLYPIIFVDLGEGQIWEKLSFWIFTALGLLLFGVLFLISFFGTIKSVALIFKH